MSPARDLPRGGPPVAVTTLLAHAPAAPIEILTISRPRGGDSKIHQNAEGDNVEGAIDDLMDAGNEEPVIVLARLMQWIQ